MFLSGLLAFNPISRYLDTDLLPEGIQDTQLSEDDSPPVVNLRIVSSRHATDSGQEKLIQE